MADTGDAGPPPIRFEPVDANVERRPWSPLEPTDALIGFGALVVGLTLAGGIVFGLISREPDRTLVSLVPQALLFVGVPIAIGAKRLPSHPWRVMGYTPFKAGDLWLVAAAMGIQIGVTLVFTLLFFTPEQDTLLEDVDFTQTTLSAVAVVLLVVIVAPITEETLFRGLFFGALRKRAPFWVAAGGSGLLFGSVHLGAGDVAVAGLLAVFGVILAWLYERTGSLGPPIALHMVNNTIAVVPLLS